MDSYLALTAHYIDKESWQRKAAVLECLPFPENHTGENIARKNQGKIHIVVRDNATNLVKAMELANLKNVGCFLHRLHLIVSNSLKVQPSVDKLITKVRYIVKKIRSSGKTKQIFRQAQKQQGLPNHSLPISQSTRWSSTYEMLVKFLSQKQAVKIVCTEIDTLSNRCLTPSDWEILPQLTKILEVFADSTKIYEKEASCISEQLPEAKCLLNSIQMASAAEIGTLKDELIAKVKKYFYGDDNRCHIASIEANELYTTATLLDGRFKKRGFCNQQSADEAELLLFRLVSEELGKSGESEDTVSHCKKTNPTLQKSEHYAALESSSGDDKEFDQATISSESRYDRARTIVGNYLQEPRICYEESPSNYWKLMSLKWPHLTKLALRYLSPPISSVASEREFKSARDIANGNRTRLLSENVKKLLFLKHNLRAIGFNTQSLSSFVEETASSSSISCDSIGDSDDSEIDLQSCSSFSESE